MNLDEPKYPERSWVVAGECGMQPIKDLETWVKGGTFHKYGTRVWDRFDDASKAVEMMRDNPGLLEIEGKMMDYRSYIEFWIKYRQTGDPDSWGYGGSYMTAQDAAYSALSMIEEHEREIFLNTVPIGFA